MFSEIVFLHHMVFVVTLVGHPLVQCSNGDNKQKQLNLYLLGRGDCNNPIFFA